MRTRNRIYNILILREKYPPLFRCDRISYSTHGCANSTLLLTDNTCVGRFFYCVNFERKLSNNRNLDNIRTPYSKADALLLTQRETNDETQTPHIVPCGYGDAVRRLRQRQ